MDTRTVTHITRSSLALGKYLGAVRAEQMLVLAISKVADDNARAEMTKALADITTLADEFHELYADQRLPR